MKANLDQWIRDARDDTPDSGEYRRLNRGILKERMSTVVSHRRRNHRVLLVSVSLVFVMLFSGQLNQLGSDDFDTIGEDLDGFNRAEAAGECELVWIQGTSYGGKTDWLKYEKQVIDGKTINTGSGLDDRRGDEPDNFADFHVKHEPEIIEKTNSTPPQRETVMTFDGVVCNVEIWVFHFPEFGEVIRYIGTPIQKNSS